MDVSVWWIAIAASVGVCAGIVLFAVLTMASEDDVESLPAGQVPMQN